MLKTLSASVLSISVHPTMYWLQRLQTGSTNAFALQRISALSVLVVFLQISSISSKPNPTLSQPSSSQSLSIHVANSTCQGTLYPELCISTVSTFQGLSSKTLAEIISSTLNTTIVEVRSSSGNCSSIKKKFLRNLEPLERRALDDCLELLDNTMTELRNSVSDLSSNKSASDHYHDLQTLMSGAMTNQYTCLDGFAFSKKKTRHFIESRIRQISRHVSNSLAMLKKLPGVKKPSKKHQREIFPEYGRMKSGFPSWVSREGRKLLQTATNETRYDLIVAKDGSGNFTTINEALAAAPNSSATRFVIYIKAGAYYEYVEVNSTKTNITLIGDGIGKTLIKGNRSVVDGWTTFRSSTVSVVGKGFIAKGITVENYAGPSKHQAVALRSGSDFSVFYNCSFIGYQDTLYVHSLRQFYRECDVYGTVDFIFGNAAVVFQNCNLYARKPLDNQQNLFTAQGREDPNQNTGISILNSKVSAASDLIPVQSSFKSYLGRPWKEYSRTVYLLCNIGDLIDPAGWLEWNGTFALSTLYYREYKNRGPGSNTTARVTWPGYKAITNATEASQFTAGSLIQGGEWLNYTGVPFYLNLTA